MEQQKGLIGELLFIDNLLNYDIPFDKIFNSWTGPGLDDKDFIFGAIGTEIKFTASHVYYDNLLRENKKYP